MDEDEMMTVEQTDELMDLISQAIEMVDTKGHPNADHLLELLHTAMVAANEVSPPVDTDS